MTRKLNCTLLFFICGFFLSCTSFPPGRKKEADKKKVQSTEKVNKIKIIDSNNGTFAYQNGNQIYSALKTDKKYLLSLKKYAENNGLSIGKGGEFQTIKRILKWSGSQWEHNGMNAPPHGFNALDILKSALTKGERYRCVEYSIVTSELLQSHGFVARKVNLRSKDVAYGGFGQGHVATEVWSNLWNKWLFLDPQNGVFLTYNNEVLNIYDIYKLKNQRKWNKIKINCVLKKINDKERKKYKRFLANYLGHMNVHGPEKKLGLSLFLEAKTPTLTFQGMANNNPTIFTRNLWEVYPEMNRVTILLDFKKEGGGQKINKDFKIKTNDDYLKNMPHFAPKPNFTVLLRNNMPNLSFYEYRTLKNSLWKKVKGDHFDWRAKSGENLLEVRAVNGFGRPGPVTFIKMFYGQDGQNPQRFVQVDFFISLMHMPTN